jgi:ppGpp synthetase/RelA/SpoT-type nucleotidyltranferase
LAADNHDTEVMQALSGADFVREQLLNALAMGPQSLFRSEHIYAIKCRIKSTDSLKKKVIDRRKNNKHYAAANATDIIGLRILTLLSERLPDIVEEFLDFVRFGQHPNIGLFCGAALDDTLHEAIVYASPQSTPIYRSVYENLSLKNFRPKSDGTARVTFSSRADYSSIHFVCHTNSYFAHTVKQIPIEVQIRTAFEDVWAEVEHPRRYKAKEMREEHQSNVFATAIVDSIDDRLSGLKQFLDSCSGVADGINRDFHALTSNPPVLVISSNNRLSNREQYAQSAPQAIKETVDTLEKTLTSFYNTILPEGRQADGFSIEKFGESFEKMKNACCAAEKQYKDMAVGTFTKDKKFDYFIKMEQALLLYWKARAIKQSKTVSSEVFEESISSALQLYYEIYDKSYYQNDSVLEYRIAACLLLWDQVELALQKYKKANAVLADDKTLPSNSEYRATIPGQYAFVLWMQFDNMRNKAVDIEKSPLRKQAAEIVAEAYKLTDAAYKTMKRSHSEVFQNAPDVETGYVNNILSYLTEYAILATRDVAVQELNPDLIEVRAAYELLKARQRNVGDLDTCAGAAEFLGDPEALGHATRLKQELDDREKVAIFSEQQRSRLRKTVTRILGEDHDHSSR